MVVSRKLDGHSMLCIGGNLIWIWSDGSVGLVVSYIQFILALWDTHVTDIHFTLG